MDWLSRKDGFLDADLNRFDFNIQHPFFEIQTIKIQVDSSVSISFYN
jgi:hypothetical protein